MSSPRTTPTSPSSPGATSGVDAGRVRSRLRAYRVMAWVAGISLLLLTASLVLEYGFDRDDLAWVAIPHGWLFMVYLVTVALLSAALRWTLGRTLLVMAAGTVPLVSFAVERWVTRTARAAVG